MKTLPTVLRTALSLLLIGGGIAGFLALGAAEAPQDPTTNAQIPAVATEVARRHTNGIGFFVDGVVVPYREVELAAEVARCVVFKAENCRVGNIVELGQRLLVIDPSDYEFEVKRLQKELEQSDANLQELEVEMGNVNNQIVLAQQDLDIRQRELLRYTEEAGLFSPADVDMARRNELSARNALQGLTDQLRLLKTKTNRLNSAQDLVETQIEKAELDLRRTEIKAPLEGVVVSEGVEQDGYVQKGTIVTAIHDTSRLEVACKLHMRQMNWLWQSQAAQAEDEPSQAAYRFPKTAVEVMYELGDTSFVWKGMLERYDGSGVDDQTRMVPCRIHVDDPRTVEQFGLEGSTNTHADPPTLMTGMFVRVRMRVQPTSPLIRLSPPAVQPGSVVWIVEDGVLQRTTVRVAHADQHDVLVYQDGGLNDGDQVVVSPLASAVIGQAVQVQARP